MAQAIAGHADGNGRVPTRREDRALGIELHAGGLMPLQLILNHQREWADRHGRPRNGHVCESVGANLLKPLHADTRAEFAAGAGDELGLRGAQKRRPNMSSLRSSAALAVNVFDPWRDADLGPLAEVLGVDGRLISLGFEQPTPHGLSSVSPHLDVVLSRDSAPPVGIECKFCEPYGARKAEAPVNKKYFPPGQSLWAKSGLPRCGELAAKIGDEVQFRRLGAGQLLKHLLAMAHTYGIESGVDLHYLWYDSGCEEATEHQEEMARFQQGLDAVVSFVPLKWQVLIQRLERHPEPYPGYHEYLSRRYGSM